MAKNPADELFKRLRDSGIRKSTAKQISSALETGKGYTPKQVRDLIGQLRDTLDAAEDRVKGGPQKRKAAAKKAANTRKRQAAKRSATAKKAAATRKRNAK